MDDRKFELESKRRNSTIQEQDLGVRVTRTVQIQKSNKITFKRLSTTLEAKRPTYSDVKVEATKHDTLYNKLKTTFAAKVGQPRIKRGQNFWSAKVTKRGQMRS